MSVIASITHCFVAPLAGARIEMHSSQILFVLSLSLPSRERGLK